MGFNVADKKKSTNIGLTILVQTEEGIKNLEN